MPRIFTMKDPGVLNVLVRIVFGALALRSNRSAIEHKVLPFRPEAAPNRDRVQLLYNPASCVCAILDDLVDPKRQSTLRICGGRRALHTPQPEERFRIGS